MQRKLRLVVRNEKYYFKDGVRFDGIHSDICGNVTGIRGDMSSIRGDVTGIRGDIDVCAISNDERSNGIDIKDLLEIS